MIYGIISFLSGTFNLACVFGNHWCLCFYHWFIQSCTKKYQGMLLTITNHFHGQVIPLCPGLRGFQLKTLSIKIRKVPVREKLLGYPLITSLNTLIRIIWRPSPLYYFYHNNLLSKHLIYVFFLSHRLVFAELEMMRQLWVNMMFSGERFHLICSIGDAEEKNIKKILITRGEFSI